MVTPVYIMLVSLAHPSPAARVYNRGGGERVSYMNIQNAE
jgi:hypothetical protein